LEVQLAMVVQTQLLALEAVVVEYLHNQVVL
jgi:hypothetical protein